MNGDDGNENGRERPSEDRTLLDPLSNDELRALREARKRMQAKKAAGKSSAIKHQIVITPDSGEERASREKPVLPSFEGDVTLDQIRVPKGSVPPTEPQAPPPERSTTVESPTDDAPTAPSPEPGAPRAGATGFGENTLLWMQPVQAPPPSDSTAPSPNDTMFQTAPRERSKRVLINVAVVVAILAGAGLVASLLMGSERGVIELSTDPHQATLFVDGEASGQTPVRLELPAGIHTLRLEKEGYEPHEVRLEVTGELDEQRHVDLVPLSQPGLTTVTVEVEPVAATVTIDGEAHPGVRTLHVPNLDPNQEHRIRVEAEGFIKTEQVIRAGQLERSYQFTLERDEG